MGSDFEITGADAEDLPALAENAAWAFGSAAADIQPWFDRIGRDNLRVLRKGGRIVGQLAITWMGQYHGGRSVPLAGIAAVAVQPFARGGGGGTRLMAEMMREARGAGYPLSGLYPATQPVYRSVGYEVAGTRWKFRVDPHLIDIKERTLDLEPVTPEDQSGLAEVYAVKARRHEGHLDRNPYMWGRILRPKGEPPRIYKVMNGGRIEGYVALSKQTRENMYADFNVLDVAALTPAAGRRILSLWADHKSLANEFVWFGGPDDPLLMLLREQSPKLEKMIAWMIRILDVEAAFTRRGYPPTARGELHLRVTDDLLPENGGDYRVEIAGGRAQVRRGGRGAIRTSIRGLAPLFSGYLSASLLQASGLLDAEEADLAMADALLRGPMPWQPDMY